MKLIITSELIENFASTKRELLDLTEFEFDELLFEKCVIRNVVISDFHKNHSNKLSKIFFKNCHIENVRFSGALIKNCSFRGSSIERCDFRYCNIMDTSFQDSIILGCDFYRCDFEINNIFEDSKIYHSSFNKTDLQGTDLRRNNFPKGILQEDKEAFQNFHAHFKNISTGDTEIYIRRRYYEAYNIYRNLNSTFLSHGHISDANWAFVKSKQMERRTYAPDHCYYIYGNNHNYGTRNLKLLKTFHFLRYFPKFILLTFIELLCNYGESLFRVALSIMFLILTTSVLIFLSKGVEPIHDSIKPSFLQYILFSASNLVGRDLKLLHSSNDSIEIILIIQSFFGISLIGLFGFILGNKIRNS